MKYIINGDIVLSRPPEGPLAAQIGAFAKWAREQGYEHMALHFAAPNLQGARFWLSSGFVPVEYGLRRRVDERIAWANK